ncbi:hypothetical protein C8R47DRAFT_1152630 [Mycena vitilis]|nr:hypothetical protein C8R47DRAFT_1152630 [Mycena vitilis]
MLAPALIVSLFSSVAFGKLHENVADLPSLQSDFVIDGGVPLLQLNSSPQFVKWDRRDCRRKSFDEKHKRLCLGRQPIVPAAHTHAATYVLAERGADLDHLIKAYWAGK